MGQDGEAAFGPLLPTEATETSLYPLCFSGFVTSLMKHVFLARLVGRALATPRRGPGWRGNFLSASHLASWEELDLNPGSWTPGWRTSSRILTKGNSFGSLPWHEDWRAE